MHQYFLASNGIGIKFRSRYKTNSYYNVWQRGRQQSEEMRHEDGGLIEMQYNGAPTAETLAAFDEYKNAEREAYLQWRRDNASLFS